MGSGSVLRAIGCPSGPRVVDELLPALGAALDGTGPALVPVPGGAAGDRVAAMAALDQPLERPAGPDGSPDRVALVVPTSGSTGAPRGALLTARALQASAAATHARLGGPGNWLLALPTTHVAGLQVLLRSIAAGTTPVCQDLSTGFHTAGFVAAARGLAPAGRRYTSLVPTQLLRLLDDPAATEALRVFDTVLLGGSAARPELVARGRDAGVRLVTTYGMSETCGGCVYDGLPLDGVGATVSADGRIVLSGPVLFAGYREQPELTRSVLTADGFTTSDLGRLGSDGRLTVLGRADGVLLTGGELVSPEAVEAVLACDPEVTDAVVVGLPDPRWGQQVVALVVLAPADGPDPSATAAVADRLARSVAGELGRAAVPRAVFAVERLPELGIGKPDRRSAAALATLLVRERRSAG